MKHAVFCCLALFCAFSTMSGETIFQFAKGKIFFNASLPEADRAVTTRLEKDGLRADYTRKASDTWPVININANQFTLRSWEGWNNLIIRLDNLSPELSPTLNVIIRGGGKLYSANCLLRANTENYALIDLDAAAKKMDLKAITMIQLAFKNPQKNFSILFRSIELAKNKPDNPGELLSRTCDLRGEITTQNRAFRTCGSCRLEILPDGTPVIHTGKYEPGMDRWPGFQLTARIDNALLDGDFSTKTHLVAELEELPGSYSLGLGLSFTDAAQKKFWHGIGSLNGGKVEIDRMISDTGVDLENIRVLGISGYMPSFAYAYKINALRLEFRPEVIQRSVREKLEQLRKSGLPEADRRTVDGLLERLDGLYGKVRGQVARRGDIKAFIQTIRSGRRIAGEIQRRHGDRQMVRAVPSGEYGAGIADSMTSVFLDEAGYPVRGAEKAELEMAGNEAESFQVVVAGVKKNLNNVAVQVSEFTGPAKNAIRAEVCLVGHAKNKMPTYPAEYVGWYPDFLIEYQKSAPLKPGENLPFWVRLRTVCDAAPGIYRAAVTISADGVPPHTFPVQVRVYNFSLPNGSPLASANNFHMDALRQLYRIRDEQLRKKVFNTFIDRAADYKITLDFLYRGPYSALSGDGEYPALKRLNDRGELKSFCILNSTLLPQYASSVGSNPDHPEVLKLIDLTRKHLSYWSGVAKKYGVWDKAYFYGFDEGRIDAVSSRIFRTVKEFCPALPVMTTAEIPHAEAKGLENIDIWVPTAEKYRKRLSLVNELRKRNKKVWWYVCNFPRPPEPTLMLEVPAAVPRLLMGAMAQKYRPDGFLYWSVIAWTPRIRSGLGAVSDGPRTNWDPATCYTDNEEGNLFVPGKNYRILPTIRVENFRDGVEDFNMMRLTEKLPLPVRAELEKEIRSIAPVSGKTSTDPHKLTLARRKIGETLERHLR